MTTGQDYAQIMADVLMKPPVDDGKPDGYYAHAYLGRHAQFSGRQYRRGKNRCVECGAKTTTRDGPPDPDRHLSARERIVKNMIQPSPLLAWLKRKAG